MTAPLYFNQSDSNVSLHIITNKIFNAIDNNELSKVEQYIDEVFHYSVSYDYFHMFYCYAREIQKPHCCKYLQQIIHTTYNF